MRPGREFTVLNLRGYRLRVKLFSCMGTTEIKISTVNTDERKKLGIRAGDTVKVWQKIREKDKIRLQAFDGLTLAVRHGAEAGATFTVRKVASGIGVEKIFPLYSPMIDKIEILKRAKVRRAKLYHIRHKAAKEVRRQMRNIRTEKVQEEAPAETSEAKKKIAEK